MVSWRITPAALRAASPTSVVLMEARLPLRKAVTFSIGRPRLPGGLGPRRDDV